MRTMKISQIRCSINSSSSSSSKLNACSLYLLLISCCLQNIAAQANTTQQQTNDFLQQINTTQEQANFYQQSTTSSSKILRVNVSNICEKNHMRATIRLSRPFYGLIHTKDKRKRPACFIEGNGEQAYTLEISYTLVQSEANFCGVVSHHNNNNQHSLSAGASTNTSTQASGQQQQNQQTLSVALVVRLHKTIEFSDDRYFLLSCANRCARPDCSTLLASQQQAPPSLSTSNLSRGQSVARNFLSTSESILAPILRPSPGAVLLDKQTNNGLSNANNLQQQDQPPCDTLLDLKFQWLVKLCWILALLLLLMFCTAYGLCLALNRSKIPQIIQSHPRQSTNNKQQQQQSLHTNKTNKSQSKKSEILVYPSSVNSLTAAQALVDSTTSTTSTTTPTTNWPPTGTSADLNNHTASSSTTSTTTCQLEDLEKIREDNSFLAKHQHQQQMMFANQLLEAEQTSAHSNVPLIDRIHHHHHHHQQQQHSDQLLLGRSADHTQSRQRQQHEARVKRRRSIGSFTANATNLMSNHNSNQPINMYSNDDTHQNKHLLLLNNHHQPANYKLHPSVRAKSKSQNTIHYDQSQDPFETTPFSYLNNGYLSDNGTNQASSTNNDSYQNVDHNHNQQQQHQHLFTYPGESMQLTSQQAHQQHPMTVQNKPQQPTQARSELMRHQKWPNLKPTYVAPPHAELVQHQLNQVVGQSQPQLLTSQFDPQNSRQLIDLIQLKHRQQIAQANRTAASMQELPQNMAHHHMQQQQQQQQPHNRNNMPPPLPRACR